MNLSGPPNLNLAIRSDPIDVWTMRQARMRSCMLAVANLPGSKRGPTVTTIAITHIPVTFELLGADFIMLTMELLCKMPCTIVTRKDSSTPSRPTPIFILVHLLSNYPMVPFTRTMSPSLTIHSVVHLAFTDVTPAMPTRLGLTQSQLHSAAHAAKQRSLSVTIPQSAVIAPTAARTSDLLHTTPGSHRDIISVPDSDLNTFVKENSFADWIRRQMTDPTCKIIIFFCHMISQTPSWWTHSKMQAPTLHLVRRRSSHLL